MNLVSCEKFFSPIFTDTEMYLAYALTVAYLSNYSSLIVFTCMVYQNTPANVFCVQYTYFTKNTVLLRRNVIPNSQVEQRLDASL